MLFDLIMDLLEATTAKEKEKAYRNLEKVGVDRLTADTIAAEFYKEEKKNDQTTQSTH